MMEFGWASGFVKPGVCHIRTVYPGGERSTYFEGTRVFVAICGAWLGPEPDVVTEDDLPRVRSLRAQRQAVADVRLNRPACVTSWQCTMTSNHSASEPPDRW